MLTEAGRHFESGDLAHPPIRGTGPLPTVEALRLEGAIECLCP
jgi:hypothetical protein